MRRTHRTPPSIPSLLLLAACAGPALTGCAKIRYAQHVDARPNLRVDPTESVARSPLSVDLRASYVEVASDTGRVMPSARYDRAELLRAISDVWNRDLPRDAAQPARLALIASLEHAASDRAGMLLHTLFVVTPLLGLPLSCSGSEVMLAIELADGRAWLGRGEGHGCVGLYYPGDHRMAALADGINVALERLEPVTQATLRARAPRIQEIAWVDDVHYPFVLQRLVWPVRSTSSFPEPWGAETGTVIGAHHPR